MKSAPAVNQRRCLSAMEPVLKKIESKIMSKHYGKKMNKNGTYGNVSCPRRSAKKGK